VADFIDSTPSDDALRDETGAPLFGSQFSCPVSSEVQEARASTAAREGNQHQALAEVVCSNHRSTFRIIVATTPIDPSPFDERGDFSERRS
jgi:hypothetical protein